ncbi:MAG: DNA polymerase-1 [Rickettsiales bacterium]|jgi:DNA polymerase-1
MSSNNSTKPKIALIDSYGFVFRAFHSLPPLTRSDGTPVGAVYGFTNMIIKLLANLQVSHIAAVFDSGSKTFRNDMYPAYKANRPPCPEELIPQFPIVREVAEALSLPILERVGFEADDLIATVAKQAARNGFEVLVISSDKDLMQLVDENTNMYDAMKNKMIGIAQVEEKFAVKPTQVLDVLSLMGDASDNVPGVRGIGPKTAAELINKYQTLENLFENLDEIKQEKRRQMLKDGVENAKLSKRLITLCETVPVSDNLEDYVLQNIDGQKLVSFLEKQGFRGLVSKVKKDFNVKEIALQDSQNVKKFSFDEIEKMVENKQDGVENIEEMASTSKPNIDHKIPQGKIVEDISQIKNLLKNATENGNLIIDFVFENSVPKAVILGSTDQNFNLDEILFTQIISNKNNDKSAENSNHSVDLFALKPEEQPEKNIEEEIPEKGLELDKLMAELNPILIDDSVKKIGYQVKNLAKFLIGQIAVSPIPRTENCSSFDDIALMAYVLNSGSDKTDLDVLVATNLNVENPANFSENCQALEKGKIPADFESENESESDQNPRRGFYCFKNFAIWEIYKLLKQRIFEQKLSNVYYTLEKPLIAVLARIENNGISVDELKLKELSIHFEEQIKILTKEIHDLAGEEFNVGSPKQLGQILFEKLGLDSGKKSKKTGALSTGIEVLEELDLEGHLIARKILQWRGFSKLKNTYADALQKAVNSETKRIHTTFSNISTSTGRLSSNNPNLQNIPIRTSEGRKIRSAFVAKKGFKLVSADYSQIELRVLAEFAGIDSLKEAFRADKDIHAITAAQVFEVPEGEVDKEMRRKAKAINFGIIYGISAFGLAKQLKISRSDAAKYIAGYFETYPGIQKYMQETREFAKENGFVQTLVGRKCFIPSINSKNPILKGLAERLAINAPIQGSAADIIKKAMIDFDLLLQEGNFKSKMILQVHDELVLEVPENEVLEVSKLLQETMQNAVSLSLPLKVDLKINENWQ